MSRRLVWVCCIEGVTIYQLSRMAFGLEPNFSQVADAAYWSAVALALHWHGARRERASE